MMYGDFKMTFMFFYQKSAYKETQVESDVFTFIAKIHKFFQLICMAFWKKNYSS